MASTRYGELRNQLMRQTFPSIFAPVVLRDADSNYVPIPISERLVQCIWYDQRLHADQLRTTDGRAVRVIFPGWWNRMVNEEKTRKLGCFLAEEKRPSLWWGIASLAEAPESLLSFPQTPTRLLCLLEQERAAEDNLSRLMLSDALFYLPDDILVKVDRASMAVSLEARSPFLDHRVVELAWQLPADLKVRAGQGKWLLRQLLHRYVPRELVDRPKAGFSVPIARWMRGRLREWVESSLDGSTLWQSGLFRAEAVRQIWKSVLNGNDNSAWQVWGLLMFQGWLEAQSART